MWHNVEYVYMVSFPLLKYAVGIIFSLFFKFQYKIQMSVCFGNIEYISNWMFAFSILSYGYVIICLITGS